MISKKIIILITVLIFIETTLALSVSPAEIFFEGTVDEQICQEIKISEGGEIILDDKWANNGISEKNINLYESESEKSIIEMNYPKEFIIEKKENIEICLSGEKEGKYFGVLLIRIKEKPVGIGIWMNVNLIAKEHESKAVISGDAISEEKIEQNNLVVIFVMILIILILIFVYFCLKLKLQNKKLT